MTIVRLLVGHTSREKTAPESPDVRELMISSKRYFECVQSYLVALVGLAHVIELGRSGESKLYAPDHTVRLDCANAPASWYWRPAKTMQTLGSNVVPTELAIERVERDSDWTSGPLNLGVFGTLLKGFGQVLMTNYFETHRPLIQTKFGGDPNSSWPEVWNFARLVRNAASHRGQVYFRSKSDRPITWSGLTYSYNDNGREILHNDLWPGDLLDLLLELDSHLSQVGTPSQS